MLKKYGRETEIIQCPYEISHQILRQRFQVHLVRCRKSYPNAEVVTCPFNITHRINKQELQWHVSNCPDRQNFETFKYREGPIEGLSTTVDKSFCGDQSMRINQSMRLDCVIIESEENWDADADVPAYNPLDYVEKSQVLRLPVGMPPAQRAAFRDAERKRLQSLKKF